LDHNERRATPFVIFIVLFDFSFADESAAFFRRTPSEFFFKKGSQSSTTPAFSFAQPRIFDFNFLVLSNLFCLLYLFFNADQLSLVGFHQYYSHAFSTSFTQVSFGHLPGTHFDVNRKSPFIGRCFCSLTFYLPFLWYNRVRIDQ